MSNDNVYCKTNTINHILEYDYDIDKHRNAHVNNQNISKCNTVGKYNTKTTIPHDGVKDNLWNNGYKPHTSRADNPRKTVLNTVTAKASNHFQLTLPCYYNSLEFIIFVFTQGYYNCKSYKQIHSSSQHKIQTCLAMYTLIHSYSYKWRQNT
jgi:hypothetical protein